MSRFLTGAPARLRRARTVFRKAVPGHLAAVLVLVTASVAPAADRHVYLDTDGDGQLNDCPNPAHNAQGSSNTDELFFCTSNGSRDGLLIGTAPGRVSAADCAAELE